MSKLENQRQSEMETGYNLLIFTTSWLDTEKYLSAKVDFMAYPSDILETVSDSRDYRLNLQT